MVFIRKHVKLILVLTTVLVCSTWYIVKRENDYFTHLRCVTKKFISEVQEEYGFVCCGIGGSLAENIKEISLDFFCYEKKSIEEARKLEVHCVERLCEMINSNKKIRPHLEEFPFLTNRVGIMICFCRKDLTNFPPEESISFVMSSKETIVYKIVFNDDRPNKTILREPYIEAYEKIKGISSDAQQDTLKSKSQSQSSMNNKPISEGGEPPIFDDAEQKALRREFEKLEKDYGFHKKAR